jgi:hypothetical protein
MRYIYPAQERLIRRLPNLTRAQLRQLVAFLGLTINIRSHEGLYAALTYHFTRGEAPNFALLADFLGEPYYVTVSNAPTRARTAHGSSLGHEDEREHEEEEEETEEENVEVKEAERENTEDEYDVVEGDVEVDDDDDYDDNVVEVSGPSCSPAALASPAPASTSRRPAPALDFDSDDDDLQILGSSPVRRPCRSTTGASVISTIPSCLSYYRSRKN